MLIIDNQIKWEGAKIFFSSSSMYRNFSKYFSFKDSLLIERTGIDISVALPKISPSGKRWYIFEKILIDNNFVQQINKDAKQYGGEKDADIFIGLYKNYIRLKY